MSDKKEPLKLNFKYALMRRKTGPGTECLEGAEAFEYYEVEPKRWDAATPSSGIAELMPHMSKGQASVFHVADPEQCPDGTRQDGKMMCGTFVINLDAFGG